MSDAPKTDIVTREKRRAELGETEFSTGTQGGALMRPRNGKELMDMANMIAGSGQMVRDFYRGNPGDCAALIMICQPYGFNPFMVSWKTYKASKTAEAPVSFEGQLVNAMVNMSAPVKGRLRYFYDGEGQTRRCTVTGIDRETGEKITYTSPMLKEIKVKNSPLWQADPDQQLGYFSARSWARRHFPELLLGVYTREEIEEAPPRDITPTAGGFASKAMAAVAPIEAEPIAEAEVMPEDESQDPPQHWTEEFDYSAGLPGSEAWDSGAKAYVAGMKPKHCPHEGDAEKAGDWLAAWHGARKASE